MWLKERHWNTQLQLRCALFDRYGHQRAFVLAALAILSFWPPRSLGVASWLIVWVALCVTTGVAVFRRQRYAPVLVWAIILLGMLSAAAALQSGLLDTVGIIIDIALFIPLVWFAIWYQRRSSERA